MDQFDKPLYDLTELRIIAADDDAFMAEMISLYIAQNEACIDDAEVLFEKKDFAGLKKLFHTIKPSTTVMGVSSAVEVIKQVELMDVNSMDEPLLKELLDRLGEIQRKVNIQLQAL